MRRTSGLLRYAILAIILIALYIFGRGSFDPPSPQLSHIRPAPGDASGVDETSPLSTSEQKKPDSKPQVKEEHGDGNPTAGQSAEAHPIDKLVYDAQLTFAELSSKESKTIEEAAQAYRQRRHRHPPPGFDKWFEFARDHDALIIEDFFDQIYHDLQPFWGVEPAVMRKESWDFEMTINVRNGNATTGSDWFWTKIWLNLVSSIAHLLPDMDLSLNAMDEPRLIVPWEEVAGYMQKASRTVKMPDPKDVVSEFQKLPAPGKGDLEVPTRAKDFDQSGPYWPIVQRGCPPDSASRKVGLQEWMDKQPTINSTYAEPHMYKGFVRNFTLSSDICHQPDLQTLEGIFIQPLSVSSSKVLFPMFGGSKLAVNNEILLPAPMYWNQEERFTGGADHGVSWAEKKNKAIWRGVATGGRNTEHNWRGFQRHRFVAMSNGTKVSRIDGGKETPENFAMVEDAYDLPAKKDGKVGEWIGQWADVGFTDLSCTPPQDGQCNYTGHYFKTLAPVNMSEQFRSKYLPDIDGNSFSGRYLGFLQSTSLPLKATVWREWHDSRLVAWKHFVPMDSRFVDYYGIMDYFLGYQGQNEHDHVAEKIADEGKEWAERVLRKEDMSIYTLRLLLEYARVLDDRRENLGWVEDALKDPAVTDRWKAWRS